MSLQAPAEPFNEFQTLSRQGTPENDTLFLDEPSCTLASRIMRAHDNPSPPPDAPQSRAILPGNYRLVDISEPTTPYRPPSSTVNHLASSLLSPTWGPLPLEPLYSEITPQRDLIIFDAGELATTASKSHPSPTGTPSSILKALEPGMPESNVHNTLTNVTKNVSGEVSDQIPDNQAPHLLNLQIEESSLSTPVPRSNRIDRLQGQSQRVVLEERPIRQFMVPLIDQATAFDIAGAFQPVSLVPAIERRHQSGPPSPSVSMSDPLGSISPSNHAHLLKTLISTETVSIPESSIASSSKESMARRLQSNYSPRPPLFADPPRTPARRMLVEDAPPSHAKFPSVPSKSATLGGFPRTPIFHIPPIDSPARRMLVEDKSHNLQRVSVPNSPACQRQNRCQSAEPSLPKASPSRAKIRSASVEPLPVSQQGPKRGTTFFKSLTIDKQKTMINKLPFPLVAEVIPEENVKEQSRTTDPKPISSSSLKHSISRIPRFGSKPYARPTTMIATKTIANKYISIPQATNASTTNKSQSPGRPNLNKGRINKSTTEHDLAVGLKRKRSSEDISNLSKTSRIKSQIHKTITFRAPDVHRALTVSEFPCASSKDKVEVAQQFKEQSNVEDTPPLLHARTQTQATAERSSLMPPVGKQQTSSSLDPLEDSGQLAATEVPIEEHIERNSSTEMQRTSRTRKKVQPAAETSRSRRRTGNVSATMISDVFSGMTAVALKTLTNANTVRNQQYIATRLETEVIRKSGPRPISPTIKTQTVLQRVQDEKGRERRERAQRRAQRVEDAQNGQHSGYKEGPTFETRNLGVWEEGHASHDDDRHRRGAGEDEDYTTPERQLKNLKPTDNPDLEDVKEGRRVKWDKSLFKAVYLDEVQLGRRPLCKDPTSRKGCLASASKVVQLDTMGNLPSEKAPVMDLIEESIFVQKFVYDDDIEVNPPIAKSTRSKHKKTKAS